MEMEWTYLRKWIKFTNFLLLKCKQEITTSLLMLSYSQSQNWFNESSTLKRVVIHNVAQFYKPCNDKPSQIFVKYSIYCSVLRQTCLHTLCAEPHRTVRRKNKWDSHSAHSGCNGQLEQIWLVIQSDSAVAPGCLPSFSLPPPGEREWPRLTQLPTLAVCLSNVMTHGFFNINKKEIKSSQFYRFSMVQKYFAILREQMRY